MAIGGERLGSRNNSVISGESSDVEAMAEELPLADGLLTNQSVVVEKALGRFAEAAASSPTVSLSQYNCIFTRGCGVRAVVVERTSRRCSLFRLTTRFRVSKSQDKFERRVCALGAGERIHVAVRPPTNTKHAPSLSHTHCELHSHR